ncbi:MAG: hypothetical protein JW934_00265 [Anaerolineae bacterium]|nr:hypothetical protein [Anaerolineae bacterium]
MQSIWTSPPVALTFFVLLVYLIYYLGGRISARSDEQPNKHQPYACGEDLGPPRARLGYHAFFHLALLFGILHLAALVISTLPAGGASHRLAAAYLAGAAISVWVLTGGEGRRV